jgi:uncharacterized membrane protein (UPF0127 family)
VKAVVVVRADDHVVVADRGALCETARERTRGLLARTGLDSDEAMLIPTQSVHTFRMRFAIDVVYLDRGGRIVAVHTDVPRGRLLPWRWKARMVVELSAGRAHALDLRAGQVLTWRPVEPPDPADYNRLAPN